VGRKNVRLLTETVRHTADVTINH